MQPELHLAFPTPILTVKVDRHKEIKEAYVNKCREMFADNPNHKPLWSRGEHAWTIFCDDYPEMDCWDDQMSQCVRDYIAYITGTYPEYELGIDSWVNVHDSTMYQNDHEHFGSIVSGIYYVKLDPVKDYPTCFVNPARMGMETWGKLNGFNSFQIRNEACAMDTFPNMLNLTEGTLILFPPHLCHLVPRSKVQHDDLRITYVFNIERKR